MSKQLHKRETTETSLQFQHYRYVIRLSIHGQVQLHLRYQWAWSVRETGARATLPDPSLTATLGESASGDAIDPLLNLDDFIDPNLLEARDDLLDLLLSRNAYIKSCVGINDLPSTYPHGSSMQENCFAPELFDQDYINQFGMPMSSARDWQQSPMDRSIMPSNYPMVANATPLDPRLMDPIEAATFDIFNDFAEFDQLAANDVELMQPLVTTPGFSAVPSQEFSRA